MFPHLNLFSALSLRTHTVAVCVIVVIAAVLHRIEPYVPALTPAPRPTAELEQQLVQCTVAQTSCSGELQAAQAAHEVARAHPNRFHSIGGSVIGRIQQRPWLSLLTINVGADDGVTIDSPVVAPSGLVGRVVAVHAHEATVVSVEDPSFHAAVMIGNGTGVRGIVAGEGRLGTVDYLEGAPVHEGDIVRTSGADGIFPPELTVGTVTTIEGTSEGGSELLPPRLTVSFGADAGTVVYVAVVVPRTE